MQWKDVNLMLMGNMMKNALWNDVVKEGAGKKLCRQDNSYKNEDEKKLLCNVHTEEKIIAKHLVLHLLQCSAYDNSLSHS